MTVPKPRRRHFTIYVFNQDFSYNRFGGVWTRVGSRLLPGEIMEYNRRLTNEEFYG